MSLTTFGTAGNDLIVAGSTLETLVGLQGDDTYDLSQFLAAEVVEEAGGGVDTILVQGGFTLPEEIENLVLVGNVVAALVGNAAANRITGDGAGNGLDGAGGNDTLVGGDGNDTYAVDAVGDVVVELAGGGAADRVDAKVSYVLGAHVEIGSIDVAGGTGTRLTGNASDNALFGNALANLLDGALGNDSLQGGVGADTLRGGDGDDVLDGESDADQLDGGNGNDTLDGGTGDDRLLGGAGNDDLRGETGADTLEGGTGNDTYRILAGDVLDGIVEAAGAGFDQVRIAASFSSYVAPLNVESVIVSGGAAFVLTGNGLGNTLVTEGGADRLEGLAGDDALDGGAGADTMAGGAGNDTYSVDNAGDQVIELAGAGTGRDLVFVSLASYVLPSGVERAWLLAGSAARSSVGNALDNELVGNEFGNRLEGGAGADLLDGRAGVDTLLGGAGDDTYGVDSAGDTIIELGAPGVDVARVGADIAWVLPDNVESAFVTGIRAELTGNRGSNTLTGGVGDDVLDGWTGIDRLVGLGGDDTYRVDTAADVVVELAGGGDDAVFARASYTMPVNVERLVALAAGGAIDLTGGAGNDRLEGNGSANRLRGLAGADTLQGGSGNDTLEGGDGGDFLEGGLGADVLDGGTGDDTYYLPNAGDTFVDAGGRDLIVSNLGQISITQIAGVEDILLADGAGIVFATGNALANRITGNSGGNVLDGREGNDFLDGGPGADGMAGGAGDDTFVVSEDGDSVSEGLNQGTDLVLVSIAAHTLAANVENATYTGTGATALTGNALRNVLVGGAGADTLNGGAEADQMRGGAGDDSYVVDSAGDVVTELAGAGIDSVRLQFAPAVYLVPLNVENVTLTSATPSRVTGNAAANVLTGAAGNDSLEGGAGNDRLDGAGGADLMTGGAGDDTYLVGSGNGAAGGGQTASEDQIIEIATGGRDLAIVSATAGYALPDFVEDLTVTGGAAGQAWAGNGLSNVLDLTLASGGTVSPGAGLSDRVVIRGLSGGSLAVNDPDGLVSTEIRFLSGSSSTWNLAGAGSVIDLVGTSGTHTVTTTSFAAGAAISLTGAGSLTLAGASLGVANAWSLHDFTGTLTLNPGAAGGGDDRLSVALDDVQGGLATSGVEFVDLDSGGVTANALGIAGLNAALLGVTVTGTQSLSLTGARDAFNLGLRDYSGTQVGLAAPGGSLGTAQTWSVALDNVGTSLLLGYGTDANQLQINTTGTRGSSLVFLEGDSAAGSLALAGNQSLDLRGVSIPTVSVSMNGPGVVLRAGFDAAVTLTVASGNVSLDLTGSSGSDSFVLGSSLDSSDRIDGGAGTDAVSATLAAPEVPGVVSLAPVLQGIETLGLTVQGSYTLDASNMDVDVVNVSGSGNIVLDVSAARGTWNANAYSGQLLLAAAPDAGGVNFVAGNGQDTVIGSDGDDRLDLRDGLSQVVTGGDGADTFVYGVLPQAFQNFVTVRDFVSGVDRLELDNDVMSLLGVATGAIDASLYNGNASGSSLTRATQPGVVKFVPSTGELYYDPDGAGALGAQLVFVLQEAGSATSLAITDVFVI